MSVIEAKRFMAGHTGGYKWEPVDPAPDRSERIRTGEFKTAWRIYTDDINDNEVTIVNHFRDTISLPYLGDPYDLGSDTDAESLCQSFDFKREDRDPKSWLVTLGYKPSGDEDEQKKPDDDGNPSPDPLDWRPEVDITHQTQTVAAWKATFRSGIAALNDGDVVCPCNAALEPFDPPAEKEIYIKIIRVTRNKILYDGGAVRPLLGAVNNAAVNISIDPSYVDVWPQYCAKVANIGGRFLRTNGIDYFATTTEVHVHPDGWRLELPNIGFHARAKDGDPDGRGNTISNTDLLVGMPRMRRMTDKHGKPMSKPVPLDEEGKPLADGLPVNFVVYSVADEIDYAPLLGTYL